jgi:hypothetical protein
VTSPPPIPADEDFSFCNLNTPSTSYTITPSFPLTHAVISPAIPHMFVAINSSSDKWFTVQDRFLAWARGSSSARHIGYNRGLLLHPISDCRNGSELLPCHRIPPSRVRIFVSPSVILCCFSRRCFFAPSTGDEVRTSETAELFDRYAVGYPCKVYLSISGFVNTLIPSMSFIEKNN